LRTRWDKLVASHADLVLGVLPTSTPEQLAPVEFDDELRVLAVFEKPTLPSVRTTWGVAAWSPRFTAFLHTRVSQCQEVSLSDVFNDAWTAGLEVRPLWFAEGT